MQNTTTPPSHNHLVAAITAAGLPDEALRSVRAWLAEQMLADTYAKLSQGGHAESQVPLRRVFVDLPVADRPVVDEQAHRAHRRFLKLLLMSPVVSLRGVCEPGVRRMGLNGIPEMDEDLAPGRESFSATLLIGGPGQGKSTLAQLACQLHRAALLRPMAAGLTTQLRELVESFFEADVDEERGLVPPPSPSLPLHVVLPEFVSWMATKEPLPEESTDGGEPAPVLLRFLADRPSARQSGLRTSTLLRLAAQLPVLLVLDGFDEVGATADRARVVAAARELLQVLGDVDVRAQVLATTRPQGYAGELADIGISLKERYLVPLQQHEALDYASRLVRAKILGADQQEKALSRLREAAAEQATRMLMTTPLQVTILAALVQQGRAPRERWRLFLAYFDYVYKREIERDSYASPLLAEHRQQIEELHRRVGLLLQVEAEREGGAASRMSRTRLAEVIDAVLLEDGVDDQERRDLSLDILKAAENRLVFLVEPVPGSFGFEIRSLQEMMAAWALISGKEEHLEARLKQVARASMFRNTLLFVASRCYSDGLPLRDLLPGLCAALDEAPEDVERLPRPGAMLALQILEEGAVLTQPKRARELMEQAVRLLDLPPGREQVRLLRVSQRDTVGVLMAAIEQRVRGPLPLGAWVALVEGTNRGDVQAIELADALWPAWEDKAGIVEACRAAGVMVGAWTAQKVEQAAAVLSPAAIVSWANGAGSSMNVWSSWILGLGSILRQRPLWIGDGRTNGALLRWFDDWTWKPPTALPPGWGPWIAAAWFSVQPSARQLADTLEVIAHGLPPDRWEELTFVAPWPLKACLRTADSSDDLVRYVHMCRAGLLGDVDVWYEAEESWRTSPDLTLAWARSSEEPPWDLVQLLKQAPAVVMDSWRVGLSTVELRLAFEQAGTRSLKRYFAEACLYRCDQAPAENAAGAAELQAWLAHAPGRAGILVPRHASLGVEDWIRLLDEHRVERFWGGSSDPFDALGALVESHGHPVVLGVAAFQLLFLETGLRRRSEGLPALSELETLLRPERLAGRSLAHALLLRLLLGLPVSEEGLAQAITSHADAEGWLGDALVAVLRHGPSDRSRFLLAHLLAATEPSSALWSTLLQFARDLQQSAHSDLHHPAIWARLGLPDPVPSPTPIASRTPLPTAPITLSSLDLRDVRGLHHIHLDLTPPAPDTGQWVVILGPNGAGKTTLLRAIALACRNLQDPRIWPRGAFSEAWPRMGTREARVAVAVAGTTHETRVRANGSLAFTQLPPQDRPRLFPLFAYGCRRGSALGGNAREVNLRDDDGPEIATLFHEGADLIQAETWLLQWDGDASRNPRSKAVFDAIRAALCTLLDVEAVDVADKQVWVAERHGARLPLRALSDGYLTSAGWFLDLVARWIALAEQHHVPLGPNFLTQMCGLVLIDEIDLHLHPRWQIEIITRTRRLLPKMSFIATTHNPLTLVGARAEEIWILSRDEGRVTVTRGVEAPVLLTGGELYRRYFGIDDIYPDGLGRKLDRYGLLASYSGRSDLEQAEMEALRAELHAADIRPGWEEVPREGAPEVSSAPAGGKKAKKRRGEST